MSDTEEEKARKQKLLEEIWELERKTMTTYRAQIIWDFSFDEKGVTESEYEWRDEDTQFSRTPEQMAEYAKTELLDALYNSVKYNDLYRMIDVVIVEE